MGQYYSPINLNTFEWLYSHDYGNGLKLMEHSYLNNSFVGVIMKLLTKGNKWYKTRIVWCGDYSENIFGETNLSSMCDDSEDIKLFKKINPIEVLDENKERNCFLVNHTKKEYVDFSELKPDEDDWIINPLSLLTAFGNGGGGGDYSGVDMGLIGSWACDVISVEFDKEELKDYEKITPDFKEDDNRFNEENNDEETLKKVMEWFNTDEVKKRFVIARVK